MERLEEMSLEELMNLKGEVMRINAIIHNKAASLALGYLKSNPLYSHLTWRPTKPAGSAGRDLVGMEEAQVKVVAEVKTNRLTGTDSNKKQNIESDLMGMIEEHPRADRYFFTIYKETADFALNLLRRRGVEGQIAVVNLPTDYRAMNNEEHSNNH